MKKKEDWGEEGVYIVFQASKICVGLGALTHHTGNDHGPLLTLGRLRVIGTARGLGSENPRMVYIFSNFL